MRFRRTVLAVCGPLLVGGVLLWSPWAAAEEANPRAQWVRDLLDAQKRDAALAALLGLKDAGACKVNHVVVCPQADGGPLYAVFKAEGYERRMGGGPGKAIGHVILFDGKGTEHPFWHNANSISGLFRDVNGDGIVENVETNSISPAAPPGMPLERFSVKVLHVLPIVLKADPVLLVAYGIGQPGHPEDKPPWHWRAVDLDADGRLEIQFGPKTEKGLEPQATYTWSEKDKRYVGPDGADTQRFKRLRPDHFSEDLDAFAKAKGV